MTRILELLQYDPASPLIFSSGLFLFLFLGFTFVYTMLQNKLHARLLFVTAFSYYFYYKSSGFYFVLLALVSISDYLIAAAIYKQRNRRSLSKCLVVLSLLVDLGLLGYFKYANFFGAVFADIVGNNFQPWDIFLPVGISFFTFQSMSYTIDIYRGQLKPLDSMLDYAFYVSFFPQLVAGPIVRATDFVPQIHKPLVVTNEMFARGVYLIIIGLFKKAVISDYISFNFVDRIFDNPLMYSGMENLMGVYGYALQIYCDFSGYSDMAIGIALLLGFHFPMNFNAPYTSVSVSDFWHRWHMSLSSWIRDYVYISLGGNRKGKIMQYVNLMITMLVCGLWHGASWNFVAWGGFHGLMLACHKFYRTEISHHDKNYVSSGWRRTAAVFLTFHFVCLMWILFRNHTFCDSMHMVSRIFTDFHPEIFLQMVSGYKYVFAIMLFGYLTHFIPDSARERIISLLCRCNVVVYALLLVAVVYIIMQVKSSSIQPFIYFQF